MFGEVRSTGTSLHHSVGARQKLMRLLSFTCAKQTFALVDQALPPPFRSKSYNVLAATHMGVAATAFFIPDKVCQTCCR